MFKCFCNTFLLFFWWPFANVIFRTKKNKLCFQTGWGPHLGEGTIWYHMVPYVTIWYHMVPYGTSAGVGRDAVRTQFFSDFWHLKKKGPFFNIKKSKNRKSSSNIEEFWPLTSGKESPRNFCHFRTKNIENGKFWVELWYFLVLSLKYITLWYHRVPYGTIRYLMVP